MSGKVNDAAGAAASLEAYFLRRILAEVKSGEGMAGGGFAGSTFKEMFDEALADSMADAGGVGLADIIAKDLEKGGKAAQPREPLDELDSLKFRSGRPNQIPGG
jgi:Rod binding domain-containing protein